MKVIDLKLSSHPALQLFPLSLIRHLSDLPLEFAVQRNHLRPQHELHQKRGAIVKTLNFFYKILENYKRTIDARKQWIKLHIETVRISDKQSVHQKFIAKCHQCNESFK